MFYYSLSLDGLIEFGAFTDKNGEVAAVHFEKCLSDRHANNNANVEWNSHFILISILNDPSMTCSGVQLIGTFTTREDQGREHLEMLSSNCHAAVLSMWRLDKFENGKFIEKEKWIFRIGNEKLQRAWDEGVHNICPMLISHAHLLFSFQWTMYIEHTFSVRASLLMVTTMMLRLLRRSSKKLKTGKYCSLFEYDKHEPYDEINHMHATTYWQIGHNNITL